jgi:hypothetical protein
MAVVRPVPVDRDRLIPICYEVRERESNQS